MRIRNGRISLALHEVSRQPGPTVLLLHSLYGTADDWRATRERWRGSVFALEFSGHGHSDRLNGSAYSPEGLLADADAALHQIGTAAVAGIGLGAYVALLLAGSRADRVPAALLLPGAGLAGGGPVPNFDEEFPDFLINAAAGTTASTTGQPQYDPMVQVLELFVRPPDYAEAFARAARQVLLVEDGTSRPPWWHAASRSPSAECIRGDLTAALQRLHAAVSRES